ncbi:MAG TPA: DUF4142 domain-containing protein [Azonexus sp.]
MHRLITWSVGAAAALLLVAAANSRRRKGAGADTGSTGRSSAQPETGSTVSSLMAVPVSPTTPAATPPGTAQGTPAIAAAERIFVAEAAASGLAEIEASRMMAARSADPGVKSFARQLEREHVSANDELKRIAGGKGIVLPEIASQETKALLDRLRSLPVPDGDRAFVREFGIEAHNKAIQLFEKEAREGQDPQLRAFAEQTLPRLREHLSMAQQLQGKATAAH